jgi:serine/threonine protein kinase
MAALSPQPRRRVMQTNMNVGSTHVTTWAGTSTRRLHRRATTQHNHKHTLQYNHCFVSVRVRLSAAAGWISPELHEGKPYNESTDVYSYGGTTALLPLSLSFCECGGRVTEGVIENPMCSVIY